MADSPIRVSQTQLLKTAPRRAAKSAPPCAMVIFGASGDLTKRLLVPALYNLARTNLLPQNFALIGVARSEETAESWAANLRSMLEQTIGGAVDETIWKRLTGAMIYIAGDLTKPELYARLHGALDEAAERHGTAGNAIFYLAVGDKFFG